MGLCHMISSIIFNGRKLQTFSLVQSWLAHPVLLIHCFLIAEVVFVSENHVWNMSRMNLGCSRPLACQQNIIWHLYLELFELGDLGLAHLYSLALSHKREALFVLKQQWECVCVVCVWWGWVGVNLRVKWIEVRIQFLLLSSIPQRGVSVGLCGFDCRCTFSFFIFVYLWFFCFARAERTSRLLALQPDVYVSCQIQCVCMFTVV